MTWILQLFKWKTKDNLAHTMKKKVKEKEKAAIVDLVIPNRILVMRSLVFPEVDHLHVNNKVKIIQEISLKMK